MTVLPLFKSHYSIGRSILTLTEAGKSAEGGPDSIVDLALGAKLKSVVLVEESFGGFVEAHKSLSAAGIQLIFGIRFTVCPDMKEKTEDSLKRESRLIVFARNTAGHKKLTKLYSQSYIEGFYYDPRIDYQSLRAAWNKDELTLAIPFYDSFLFNNSLRGYSCVPDIDFAEPTYFLENNGLPMDTHLRGIVTKFGGKTVETKSIYYANRADFPAYQTCRCVHNRGGGQKPSLEQPRLEQMSSDEFCFESWKESKT